MIAFFEWILANGNRLTVASLLLAALVFVLIAFTKEWVVTGARYRECAAERDEYRSGNDQRLRDAEARVSKFTGDLELKIRAQEVEIEHLNQMRPKR